MESDILALGQTLWNYLRLDGPLAKADCIVGLGSYDLRVAGRCADLYGGGWGPLILFSGHLGNWTRSMWDRSEAEIFAEHAIARGVPADRIKLEAKSTNIGENVKFTKELLRAAGIHPGCITIVGKPSTERRVLATSRLLFIRTWGQIPQEIPAPVWDAYERRGALGYHGHLVK